MTLRPVFNNGVFPFGAHVYREPYQDQDEIMADLPLLKRLGFNMIKIQESWAIDEPREGEYDFSRIEQIIGRAAELDLGVYMGLTMEQVPAWMWAKYPDCHLVYANGHSHNDPTQYCLPADGKPGPCWDHPGARAAGERFVAELAQRLGRFSNIWAWNTWQEIGFWPNDGGALGFCYCPHTLARFREWLEQKYSSLEALNKTWYTAYTDWETIEPPRRDAFVPSFVDWRYFMDDVYIVRALAWKTAALKANDPHSRPVFSHVASPTVGSGAEWRWAATGDFFGNSNYPAWGRYHHWDDHAASKPSWHTSMIYEIRDGVMLRGDYTRNATGRDRAFWGAEFQGGPISTHLHLGRVPSAGDIRRWMLSGLASGMNGISFWNHRAERFWSEANGFGLLDPQGETTERIEEAARIGRAINEHAALFAQGQPPRAPIALLVNEDTFHFCQGTRDKAADLYSYNLRGHYARLWRLGYPIDFVDASEVAAGALSDYRVAILPMPLALDPAYFVHLQAFVEQGGTMISDACPGRFDAYGFCTRQQMVAGGEELFGARHKRVQIVREPSGQHWTPEERAWGEFAPPTVFEGVNEYAGAHLRASFYKQTLQLTSATPILMADDEVAGVIQPTGNGQAILLGTFAGISETAYGDVDADWLWNKLLGDAGVAPDRSGALLRRRRVLGSEEAWLLLNITEADLTETLDTAPFSAVRDLLGDAITAQGERSVTVRIPAASLCCLVLAR